MTVPPAVAREQTLAAMSHPPRQLILGSVPDDAHAQRLADALRRWGVEPFVAEKPWGGGQQVFVGFLARNAHEECLLDDLFQEAGLPGEVLRQVPPEGPARPEQLCLAFSTRFAQQAQALQSLLDRAGIESLMTDRLGAQPGVDTAILVRAADQSRALQVVEHMQSTAAEVEPGTGPEGDAADVLVAWPQCPGCGALRETCCPKCRSAGAQWQQADSRYLDPQQAAGTAVEGLDADDAERDDGQLVVICPTCDWMFSARFYRRCAMCSHDFGSGIDAEARATSEAEAINPRVIAVVLVLGVLLIAVLAYFALL